MITKKVNRYYCEYCKKSGGSKHHLQHHEKRCTLNPSRVCGYCKMLENEQPEMAGLVALLPNPKDHEVHEDFGAVYYGSTLHTAVDEALPKLREAAGNCPACIMAALRQKGIPVPMATDFSFKKECQEIWDGINAEAMRAEQDRYY